MGVCGVRLTARIRIEGSRERSVLIVAAPVASEAPTTRTRSLENRPGIKRMAPWRGGGGGVGAGSGGSGRVGGVHVGSMWGLCEVCVGTMWGGGVTCTFWHCR